MAAAGLATAGTSVISKLQVKTLTMTEPPGTIAFYFALVSMLIGLITWPFGWAALSSGALIWLVAAGLEVPHPRLQERAFVLEPEVIDRIAGDETIWEQEPLKGLAADGQLTAYHHNGFWQPMDTLRDRQLLEDLWNQERAPWKVW
jgi:hypothetical protein